MHNKEVSCDAVIYIYGLFNQAKDMYLFKHLSIIQFNFFTYQFLMVEKFKIPSL